MFAVEATNLTKTVKRAVALDAVSLTVARGECVAVLGQNGSGKSTLVRLLSTLLLPDAGSARVFGHDVAAEEGRSSAWSTASRSRRRSSSACPRARTWPTPPASTG